MSTPEIRTQKEDLVLIKDYLGIPAAGQAMVVPGLGRVRGDFRRPGGAAARCQPTRPIAPP